MSLQLGDRGCHARAVPANFMNGPAWGVGQRAGPPPHFPELRLRHAAPHVAASRAPLRPGLLPAGQLLRMGLGRLPARVPATPPAGNASGRRHASGGPAGALCSGASFLGFWNGFLKREVVKLAFNPFSLKIGSPGRSLTTGRGWAPNLEWGGVAVAMTLGGMEVQSPLGVLGFLGDQEELVPGALGIPKSMDAQVPYIKWCSICTESTHMLLYVLNHF